MVRILGSAHTRRSLHRASPSPLGSGVEAQACSLHQAITGDQKCMHTFKIPYSQVYVFHFSFIPFSVSSLAQELFWEVGRWEGGPNGVGQGIPADGVAREGGGASMWPYGALATFKGWHKSLVLA